MASSAWMEATASEGLDRRSRDESVTGEELVAVELGERDRDGAGALAEAGGAALVVTAPDQPLFVFALASMHHV